MDANPDIAVLKVIAVLTANFLLSFTMSNWLVFEIDLIKSPVTSLKIFCSTYCLGYIILITVTAKNIKTAVLLSPHVQQNNKGICIVASVFKFWFCGIVVFHCLAVLYGASLSRYVEETFMWSVLMSDLVVLPSLLVGINEILTIVVAKRRNIGLPLCLCIIMMLTLLGAWFGAFTLPLDWDRDWQVWPIPCAAGAMMGHLLSLLISGALVCWKYRNKDKSKFI